MSSASQFGTLITVDGVVPVLGNVAFTSTGGTITITPGVGTIDFEAVGGGGGGVTTIDGDSGSVTGATITLTGGASGAVFTGAGTTMTLSFNELNLPNTTSSTVGVININSVPFMHAYPGTANLNVFIGGAGNFTNSGGTNLAISDDALHEFVSGTRNVALGVASLELLATGSNNIAVGAFSGNALTGAESNNIYLGSIGVAGESGVMRLGLGNSVSDPTTTYIAGINGNAPSGTALLTYTDTTGVMSSAGEVLLPDTTSSSLGVVNINSVPYLHAYPGTASVNTWIGGAGNFTASGALQNIGIGSQCLKSIGTAFNNICMGLASAESITTGNNNVAIGTDALTGLVSGNGCTIIGIGAGDAYTSSESNNICLGGSVAGIVGESNAMHLGDSGTITTAYIGGTFGNTPSGTAQVTYVDTNGLMSSLPFAPTPAAVTSFFAYSTTGQTVPPTSSATISFDTEAFDTGSNFNTGTNTFTAPSTSLYHFQMNIAAVPASNVDTVALLVNGNQYFLTINATVIGVAADNNLSTIIQLTAGDVVMAQYNNGAPVTTNATILGQAGPPTTPYLTWFACYQLT